MRVSRVFVFCALVVPVVSGCRRSSESQPPVATPSVKINHAKAALGSPIAVTYRFEVAGDARFDQDYTVMVHFVDTDDELMWTDDHRPPVATSQWKAGQTVEYTRTIFVPVYPYLGEAAIQALVKDDRFAGQRTALPSAGLRAAIGERQVAWHAVDTLGYNVNLFHFAYALGQPTSNVLFWTVTVVDAPRELPGVRLAIRSNAASVW